jgi:membrane associated rhomboid family serine protease
MGSSRPLAGAVIGALILVVANVAFAWFASAPDHQEWTDPAVFMSPFAALFGAIAGAAVAALTRPPGQGRPDDRSRSEKRKYR